VQSISRGERMDYTIQKAVELGVLRIVPVVSARTVCDSTARARKKNGLSIGAALASCHGTERTYRCCPKS